MTYSRKSENVKFFKQVLSFTKEGGTYVYPDVYQVYTVQGGNLVGSNKGIKILKKITTKDFHKYLKVG